MKIQRARREREMKRTVVRSKTVNQGGTAGFPVPFIRGGRTGVFCFEIIVSYNAPLRQTKIYGRGEV